MYFPQVATGEGFATDLTLLGLAATTTEATLTIYEQDGGVRSIWQLRVPEGGSARFRIGDTPEVRPSWAELEASTAIEGMAAYEHRSRGALTTKVAVLGTRAARRVVIPVQTDAPLIDTGVAIANVGNALLQIRMILIDENGNQRAQKIYGPSEAMGRKEQFAKFVTELFSTTPGIERFRGKLLIEALGPSDRQFSVTGLSFKEGLLSGIPVVILE